MTTGSAITRIADALWTRLPAAAGRRLPLLGAILADGRYLLGVPALAVLAPVAALVAGAVVGGWRPLSDQLFTFSVAWPAVLLAFGSLGAALGFWAWLGFVAADFFIYGHVFFELDPVDHLVKERLPLLILYEVLFALVVLSPIAVRALPASLTRVAARFIRSPWALFTIDLCLAAFVAALTAASWSASAGVLVRPLATFHDGVLGPQAVQPLRHLGSVLVAVAVAGALLRRVLELALERSGRSPAPFPDGPTRRPSAARQLVGAVLASALLTLGLAGILDGPSGLPVLFAILFASTVGRSIVLPRVPAYAVAVGRIPALLRVLAMGGVGYLVGLVVTSLMIPGGFLQVSWQPVLVAVAGSLAVATFLFPGAPLPRSAPGSASAVEAV